MKILQPLTSLLLLLLLALSWATWEMWRQESNASAVDEIALRQQLGMSAPTPKDDAVARFQKNDLIREASQSAPTPAVANSSNGQAQNTLALSNSVDQMKLLGALVIIETESGQGSGFIVSSGNKKFTITNRHVIQGASNILMRTVDGVKLLVRGIELSDTLDAARLSFYEPTNSSVPTLTVSTNNPVIGDKISVYGNSLGKGAITMLDGAVLGIGPDAVEVNADFVPGNSGSPILDARDEVIGIATLITRGSRGQDWVTRGTRFEEVRRFGVRISIKDRWIPVEQKLFYKQAKLLERANLHIGKVKEVMCCWLNVPDFSQDEAAARFSNYVRTRNQLSFQENPWEIRLKDFAEAYVQYWKLKNNRRLVENSLSLMSARGMLPQTFCATLSPLDVELKQTQWLTKSLRKNSYFDGAEDLRQDVNELKKIIERITKTESVFWQNCVIPDSLIKLEF